MLKLDRDFLRGSYTPLVTPFRDGEIDEETYAGLADRQVVAGSHGVVVAGTTGEPSTLTVAERRHLLETALAAVDGRVPVVAATGSQSLAETLELSRHAEAAGAAAVLVVTPYYLRPPGRGLVEYFRAVGAECALPLLVYHIPGRAAVAVDAPTFEAIAEAAPTFVGCKHASSELGLVSDLIARFGDDIRVLVGLEELSLPMLALGASGVVNAVGNLVPERVAALTTAVLNGDLATGRKLHYELLELNRAVFWDTNPIPMKYLMVRMGLLPSGEHRLPMVPPGPELARRLDSLLDRAGWSAVSTVEVGRDTAGSRTPAGVAPPVGRCVRVGAAADLPPGAVVTLEAGGRSLAVGNSGGRYFALDGVCSHGAALLGDGYLEGDELECPLHSGRFCVFTGEATARPAREPVRSYPVDVRDGELHVMLGP